MIPVLAKGHLPATPSIPPLSSHFFEQNFPLASHFLTVAPPPEIVRANEYTGCVKVPFPLYKPTHPPHTPHSPPVYKPTCPRHTPLTLLLSTNPRIHYTAHPSLSSCLQTHVPTSHTPHSLPVHKPTHPPHTPHSLPVHKPTCPLHHTPLTLFLSTNPRIHLTHLTLFLSTNTRAHYTAHPSLSSCPQTHASTTPHTPHSLPVHKPMHPLHHTPLTLFLSTNPRIHYTAHPSLSSVHKPTHPLHHTPLTLFLSTNPRAHYTAHPSLSSCPQTHASTAHPSLSSCLQTHASTTSHTPQPFFTSCAALPVRSPAMLLHQKGPCGRGRPPLQTVRKPAACAECLTA